MRSARGSSSTRRPFGAALGLVALLALGACGGGGGGGGDAVASIGATSVESQTATTVAGSDQDKILAYTACLREQGLDVADPTFDADGTMSGRFFGPESGIEPGSAEFQAAQDACGSLVAGVVLGGRGGGNFDPEAMQAASLAYTECLRDQGLEVDDLDLSARGGPGGGSGVGPAGSAPAGGASGGSGPPAGGLGAAGAGGGNPTDRLASLLGLDPEDPATAAALEVCAPVLQSAMNPDASTTVPS